MSYYVYLSPHREHGTGCRQSRSCCNRPPLFLINWKHFCSSQPTDTGILTDDCFVMCPRSSSRACNTNTPVTVTVNTHTHPFNGPFCGTTWVSQYQRGKTNLDFTEARDSKWQWHQLGHMQVCTSLQTDNHASTQPLSFLQARCPFCCSTNSVKALKAIYN